MKELFNFNSFILVVCYKYKKIRICKVQEKLLKEKVSKKEYS